MAKKHRAATLVLLCAAFAAGCISLGGPFSAAKVPSIVLNKTTQEDLGRMFGEPYRTGIEDGDTTWTYVDYRLSLLGTQRTRDLYIRFNANGTVKTYAFNSN